MKKTLATIGKIIMFIIVGVLSLLLLTLIGLNIGKFFIYNDYYSIKNDIC